MVMQFKPHGYKIGTGEEWFDTVPGIEQPEELELFAAKARKRLEPWLSAVFQAEHLNLLIGSGFTVAVARMAKAALADMNATPLGTRLDAQIGAHATQTAMAMGRGSANIEDQFRTALTLLEALGIVGQQDKYLELKTALNTRMTAFLSSILETEQGITNAASGDWEKAVSCLQSFLLSFASRSASRERLHVFTTNYDRLIEYGCDLAGLRMIDRFVGALEPVFRSSRVDVDYHYNPPGIRGEPRFMEGVIRLSKIHGSLDWHMDPRTRKILRRGISFGESSDGRNVPSSPTETVMIYPNAAKDVETTAFPYAEIFRDMAAALCRPNAAIVIYGYGFGDDHINRILADMLTIPSTHIVIFAYSMDARLTGFLERTSRPSQVSLLVGSHFADLARIVESYLPKPAIDLVSSRVAELLKSRAPLYEPQDGDAQSFVAPLPPIVPAAPIAQAPLPPIVPAAPIAQAPLPPIVPAAPVAQAPLPPIVPAAPVAQAPLPPIVPAAPVAQAPLPPIVPAAPDLPWSKEEE